MAIPRAVRSGQRRTKTPPGNGIPSADPFLYGYRLVHRKLPNGEESVEQVPLTLEDVLHPQEGDHISERPRQKQDSVYLDPIFRQRAAERLPGGYVTNDCLINWGIPGMPNHSPDLAVFRDVYDPPEEDIGTFYVAQHGGKCVLGLEIVSPTTRVNDVTHKRKEYHQAGVPLYVIVDQEREGGPRRLVAYRHTRAGYRALKPDAAGRILLEPLGLRLGLHDNRVVCFDAESGEELGDYARVDLARKAAEKRVRELEAELHRFQGRKAP